MSKEEQYLLQILSDFIYKRPTSQPSESLDWMALFEIADNHEIEGIVYNQCRSFIPKNISNTFESAYSATMFFYANRKNYRSTVVQRLTEKGIPHFTIKGEHIASYYAVPALRTSGDIDLVVHPEDRDAVYNELVDLGFKPPYRKSITEWNFWKNNVELELHNALAYNISKYTEKQYEFFGKCWDYVEDNILDINYHFIFLIIHMFKHFKSSGIGIRHFLDIAIITVNPKDLDFKWIEDTLIEVGLIDFAKTVLAINKRWFGVDAPFSSVQISDELYEVSTEYIFNNGVFGKQNSDTVTNMAVNNMLSGKSKFKLLREHLFPSYSQLTAKREYSWLKGKRYLLPAAWVKKYTTVLFKKDVKSAYRNVAKKNVSKKDFEERVDFLNHWGIDMSHNKRK